MKAKVYNLVKLKWLIVAKKLLRHDSAPLMVPIPIHVHRSSRGGTYLGIFA